MEMPVLVLNANFEPLNICDIHRALGLLLSQKAYLVENGRGVIKTVSTTYPLPSVIRLHRMVRRPRPVLKLTRREVFRRDNYTCQYCGKHTGELTIDHVIPRHLGGKHVWENVVTACPACNHRKGGRTLSEANMHLLQIPKEPPSSAMYVFGKNLLNNNDWTPYLIGW